MHWVQWYGILFELFILFRCSVSLACGGLSHHSTHFTACKLHCDALQVHAVQVKITRLIMSSQLCYHIEVAEACSALRSLHILVDLILQVHAGSGCHTRCHTICRLPLYARESSLARRSGEKPDSHHSKYHIYTVC